MKKIVSSIILLFLIFSAPLNTEGNLNSKSQIQGIINNIQLKNSLTNSDKDFQELRLLVIKFELDEIQKELVGKNEIGLQRLKALADFIKGRQDSTSSVLAYYVMGEVIKDFFDEVLPVERLKILERIVNDYPGTVAAKVASVDYYQLQYLNETDLKKKQLLLFDYQKSLESFMEAESESSFLIEQDIIKIIWLNVELNPRLLSFKPELKLRLGWTYEQLGDKDKAVEIYSEVVEKFSGPEAQEAQTRLNVLNGSK